MCDSVELPVVVSVEVDGTVKAEAVGFGPTNTMSDLVLVVVAADIASVVGVAIDVDKYSNKANEHGCNDYSGG